MTTNPPNIPPVDPNAAGSAQPPQPPAEVITDDEKTFALLAHLLGIFTYFVGALVIWLIKKDQSSFLNDQAKEALNFQITVAIAWVVAFIGCFLFIGFLLFPVIGIGNLVFCIIAALKSREGVRYRYPVIIRFIK